MSQNNAAGMITVAQAMNLLMLSDEWLRQLAKKGYVPKAENGLLPLVPTVQGYIRWLKDEERARSKTAAQSAVQQARAEEIRLRVAREQGRLVEVTSAETLFADVIGSLRSELDGLPAAVTRDLSLRETIQQHMNAAIERARERFEDMARKLREPK